MSAKILALIPVPSKDGCLGCALNPHGDLFIPQSDGCRFRDLCGEGQFQAKLLRVESLTLEDLPNAK